MRAWGVTAWRFLGRRLAGYTLKIRACLVLSDAARTSVTLSDAKIGTVTLSDAVTTSFTLSDAEC